MMREALDHMEVDGRSKFHADDDTDIPSDPMAADVSASSSDNGSGAESHAKGSDGSDDDDDDDGNRKAGSLMNIPEAPVYSPTQREWADPMAYIQKIRPEVRA
jgi:hypothetical protein